MMKLSDIDQNFKLSNDLGKDGLVWINARDPRISLYGLFYDVEKGAYFRLPEAVAETVSPGVKCLACHTAGGRIRFCTDSEYVAITALQKKPSGIMPHMAFLGSSGFDAYVFDSGKYVFCGSFIPPVGRDESYQSIISFEGKEMRDITINFPLYDRVDSLFIGISDSAVLCAAPGYALDKPIVYYGSSITQGGCASRPGTSYEAIISRDLNLDYINLGFSGSAYAEQQMAGYLASLDPCVYVLDYDHNAPDDAFLKKTHWPLYETIRSCHPDVPIVFVTRPDQPFLKSKREVVRKNKAIILANYNRAAANGDQHIYYIDGNAFFSGYSMSDCTVDGTHPNDLGFYRMAKVIGASLSAIISDLRAAAAVQRQSFDPSACEGKKTQAETPPVQLCSSGRSLEQQV